MAIVIHWSTVRGFGILRSQAHGEVTFQAASLTNTKELSVGDMVTFEMGFDKKKNKPEATHIFKAGQGRSVVPPCPVCGSSVLGQVGAGAPGETSTSSTKDSEVEKKDAKDSKEKEKDKGKEKDSKEAGRWQFFNSSCTYIISYTYFFS